MLYNSSLFNKDIPAKKLSSDDVIFLVTCIWGEHNNDTDLVKLDAEMLPGRQVHLAKTSVFLLGLSSKVKLEYEFMLRRELSFV